MQANACIINIIMKVDQLKANLVQAICEGYADYCVNFCDQDGDSVTIDKLYLDSDGDVCLESNEYDNNDFSAQELLDELDRYSDKRDVYVYNDDIDTSFDIDEEDDDDDYDDLWYIGNDGYLYMDMSYEED